MDEHKWVLYILECRTKELYVGIAQDIKKRVDLHNEGRACRYTKFRGPVRLVYFEAAENYGMARLRESQVKKYSRAKKFCLVKKFGDLSPNERVS